MAASDPLLILASTSPRRRELLKRLGLPFQVERPQAVERRRPGEAPGELVERLAREKAEAVASRWGRQAGAEPGHGQEEQRRLVIGADTVVVLDGEILGKPKDLEDAKQMLRRLSGRTHEVYTGVAVLETPWPGGPELVEHEVTRVTFRPLTSAMIEHYVASGEPMDKAGAYGVQGLGSVIVSHIDGCFFNVVGLPLPRLAQMLERLGQPVL
ncbi:MAG: septum formation inhibitor Maf [Limnochordaceae bacterium]|nr:septum formation inhibitor Maf [Limnochordaceae bacterium]